MTFFLRKIQTWPLFASIHHASRLVCMKNASKVNMGSRIESILASILTPKFVLHFCFFVCSAKRNATELVSTKKRWWIRVYMEKAKSHIHVTTCLSQPLIFLHSIVDPISTRCAPHLLLIHHTIDSKNEIGQLVYKPKNNNVRLPTLKAWSGASASRT